VLVQRLLYYPVVQVISRFGLSWFELEYGFAFGLYDGSSTRFAVLCLAAAAAPCCALGYLIIFLKMQPRAWLFLLSRVTTGRRYVKPLASGKGVAGSSAGSSSGGNNSFGPVKSSAATLRRYNDAQQDINFNQWEVGAGAERASEVPSESSGDRYSYSLSSLNSNECRNLEDDELLNRIVVQQQSYSSPAIEIRGSSHLVRSDIASPILPVAAKT